MPNSPELRTYRDRREAGRVLAARLSTLGGRANLVVLGLARGGVPVGWEVAAGLRAPFDVFLVRKLGAPRNPELAMGAVASGGAVVINDSVVHGLGITDRQIDEVLARETAELDRRERAYRDGRRPVDVRGRTVVVVDDGVATGASMRSALRAVRSAVPAEVIAAIPVGPPRVCEQFTTDADRVVCASIPARLDAVGQAFADFHQVTDGEVRALMQIPTATGPPWPAGGDRVPVAD